MDAPTEQKALIAKIMGREVNLKPPKPEQFAAVKLAVSSETMSPLSQYQVVFSFLHSLLPTDEDKEWFTTEMALGNYELAEVLKGVQELTDRLNKEKTPPPRKRAAKKPK